MFDIGWTELLVVATVAIIVVGPKDLPRMLRTFGQTVGKLRRMAGEFQSTFNDAIRDAEKQANIDEMREAVEKAGNFDPLGDIKKSIEHPAKAGESPAAAPSAKATAPEEPAKTGATAVPGEAATSEGAAGAPADATASAEAKPREAAAAAAGETKA